MNAIDWLRGKAKQKAAMASGGIVHGDRVAINLGGGYLMPTSAPEPDEAQPIGFVEFTGELTEQQVQQVRDSIQIIRRPSAPETRMSNIVTCGRWPRYSECRCKEAA